VGPNSAFGGYGGIKPLVRGGAFFDLVTMTRNNLRVSLALVSAALGAFLPAQAANLQTQDLLFISKHRNPTIVESDDKVAYVLTEGGVLMYDYRRRQWQDNIAAGQGIKDIAYNPSQNRLLMLTSTNTVLEYNPSFRRVTPSTQAFNKEATGSDAGDLSGLSVGRDYFWLGDAVRDQFNRRVEVNTSRVFDYDNMWLLTAGHGAFLGSQRRKDLASNWFGLYDSSVTAIHADGKSLWFGSPVSDGAVVSASNDLTGWRVYPGQQDYTFPDAAVQDIVTWRGSVWFATNQGVVRHDPETGKFQQYRRMLGSTDMKVNRLIVHRDRLYAGTERGIASLGDPSESFRGEELPINVTPAILDFHVNTHPNGVHLWAASDFGLLVLLPNGWRTIRDVTRDDVPEAYGIRVAAVAWANGNLYWSGDDRLYVKPQGEQPRTVFNQDGIFRLATDGGFLYAAHTFGVRVYNLKNNLWTDFRLEDGIPGRKVTAMMVRDGFLWIGTDFGVMRIRARPYLP
jgi:ligand-binding sensor domain-containing protein